MNDMRRRIALAMEDEVPKITKPDWLDQKILDRLLAAKVLVSMPVEETLDYWRMLVLQDRTLTAASALAGGGTASPHTHTATVTSVVAVS